MNKLITIVGCIALSFSLHAGSYLWGFGSGDYTDHNGDWYENGTAFLFLNTVTASESAFDTSSATLVTYGGYDSSWYQYGNGDPDNLSSSDAVTGTSGIDYTLILLEKSGATPDDLNDYEGYYALVTGVSDQGEIPGATVVHYASFVNYDAVSTSSLMEATASPEPTSGLLVLFGLAGLALKRKRA